MFVQQLNETMDDVLLNTSGYQLFCHWRGVKLSAGNIKISSAVLRLYCISGWWF